MTQVRLFSFTVTLLRTLYCRKKIYRTYSFIAYTHPISNYFPIRLQLRRLLAPAECHVGYYRPWFGPLFVTICVYVYGYMAGSYR
jgi:hypothetical protein